MPDPSQLKNPVDHLGMRPEIGDEAARSTRRGQGLVSSSAVGSANRGRLLQALFDLGPTSRAELARYSGVNRATISGIIQPLVDQRILVEGDPIQPREGGGKPARPLWFAKDAPPICGVMVMHDGVRSCLVSLTGEIDAEHAIPFPAGEADQAVIAGLIADCVRRTLSASPRAPLGIGVAAGGMVDTTKGSIVLLNMAPALAGLALGPYLSGLFGLVTTIDHHPRGLLVGDKWFGIGRGKSNFAVIYTGEVLGTALFLNGKLYRGPAGAGGELGHTFVQVDGTLCRCGRRGCWETIATLSWLRREAQARGLPQADMMTSGLLRELVESEQAGAASLFDLYARNLAVGIANLQQIMAPNFVVLHGDVVAGGTRMVEAIAAHVRDLVPSRPDNEIELALGDVEDVAALRGAAGLVLSQLLHFEV